MAWLFDAYPHPRSSHIVVWVLRDIDGPGRWTKHLVPYHPTFCVQSVAQPLSAAQALLAKDKRVKATWVDRQALWLRGPDEDILRVQTKRLQDIHPVATALRKATHSKGFLFFDVDHQAESRWMHEQGIWTMCHLDEEALARGEFRAAAGEDRYTLEYPDPPLRTLRLAVDVNKQGREKAFDDPLKSIRVGDTELRATDDPGSERGILLELGRRIQEVDPDVLITKHGDRFDIPFLLRRIRQFGLQEKVWLGRDRDPDPGNPDQQGKSIHTYGRWLYKTHAYYLRGRWHIDLSKKTLDSEDDRKDIHGILYLARISNRRAQDINRNGAGYALQQMQIDHATDLGTALPWKRNLAEDWKDAATLCAVDRGGQIMVPTPGIYEDVAACDFSGYYPSLVVRHNLSSDTINCQCCPDGPVIPELGYHICQKVQGHQSEILRRIWSHRRWVKAVLKKAKS